MRTLFLDPGALRSELALQATTPVPDGLGGHMESWAEIATVFGGSSRSRRRAVSARPDRRDGDASRDDALAEWCRRSGMRFVRQDRIFDIVTVHDPDDTGRYLVCRAREVGCETWRCN